MAASRAGSRRNSASRRRISSFHSGILNSCDAAYGGYKLLPALPLFGEHLGSLGRQAIIAAAALAGLFHPAALNPAILFKAVQQRIKGGHVEAEGATGTRFDQFANVITMARLVFDQGEDQQLGTAFFPFTVVLGDLHMWQFHICHSYRSRVKWMAGERGRGRLRAGVAQRN